MKYKIWKAESGWGNQYKVRGLSNIEGVTNPRSNVLLTWKDFVSLMHGDAVYVKEGLCERHIARKLWGFLFMYVFNSLCFIHCLIFFLYWSPSYSLCTVIDAASYKIDEVLSITPSAKVFVLRNLNVHHKGWLTYSGGTDDLVNSPINFLFQTT